MFKCPNCKIMRADEPDKCWNCGADRRGVLHEERGKHAVQTRDITHELNSPKHKCPHGLLKWHQCVPCGRWGDDVLLSYRRSAEADAQKIIMESYGIKSGAEASVAAKALLDKM